MFIYSFENMVRVIQHKAFNISEVTIMCITKNSCACSFTEFLPFCRKLYCFSSFKDFNTIARA